MLRLLLTGLLCILAPWASAREALSGASAAEEPVLQKWKSLDGQELYEVRATKSTVHFERVTPVQDRMYGEFFRGAAEQAGDQYVGKASAAVLQVTQGRASHTCTISMSVTLSSVTPTRIEGKVRPERIDPDCAPDNFSSTMTAPAFTWIPAAQSDAPPPQIQRRIEASLQYRRRIEATEQGSRQDARNRQADLEPGQRPNNRLRGCEAALRQQFIVCSAHYPHTYPGRPYLQYWGQCGDAQSVVRAACY